VAILRAVIRLILWVIVILIGATWLGRKLAAWLRAESGAPSTSPDVRGRAEPKLLQRDPVCGTYVSPEISVTLEEQGQIVHFCSVECREKYSGTRARASAG
jgi:YHS domain-containing protein